MTWWERIEFRATIVLLAGLAVGLILAIGCSSAQRAASSIPPEGRVRLELTALRLACGEMPGGAAPELVRACELFSRDDAPSSGDGGPSPILEERKPSVGPGEGNVVRSVGGRPAQ